MAIFTIDDDGGTFWARSDDTIKVAANGWSRQVEVVLVNRRNDQKPAAI
ncbi:MAG: hypothetical protein H6667_22125 [Ardenticatenaceae bacterium]|nr:hypothetical protein [Ardenticatenaceae bacterium]